MKHQIDLNYYPGWVRKAITFSIDDGKIPTDSVWLSYMKPAGILGTFNLSTPLVFLKTPEEYRTFYEGYEIANHSHFHPLTFREHETPRRPVAHEPFDPEKANPDFLYPTEEEGVYKYHLPRGWRNIADDENYIRCVQKCQNILTDVFGQDAVKDFVWPFGEQPSREIRDGLLKMNFRSIRKTDGNTLSAGFDLPADRNCWAYNANHTNLLLRAEAFENLPDDGKLKVLCLGVHSIDYENAGKWDDVAAFVRKYGNQPEKYWSGTVGQIFEREDAIQKVLISENEIKNPTEAVLYLKIDGIRKTLFPHSVLQFS